MFYEIKGSKHPDAPLVVFCSGLGGSADFWQSQLPAIESDFRILVYDQLGTGRSSAKLPADYSIDSMASELLNLLRELHVSQCHFVGHALGGLVGLEIALQCPEILQSMVLINAWSSPNPHTLRCFHVRKAILANCAPEIYLQTQAILLYPPDWIAANVGLLEKQEQLRSKNFPDPDNLLLRIKALSEFDVDADLATIEVNTLLIANKDDVLVPWQRSEVLLQNLTNAQLKLLDYGGHACTLTVTDQFNEILTSHLTSTQAQHADEV